MRAFTYLLIGLLLLVPAFVSAQTQFGGVRGAVSDTDGGVLPGTTVTLTNNDTGQSRTSVTNERGEYVFARVAPGRYDLTVTLAGFAPYTRQALDIGVDTYLHYANIMVVFREGKVSGIYGVGGGEHGLEQARRWMFVDLPPRNSPE